eukprot:jgi/Botrbrau1/19257/Bobra.0073s0007.1
MRKASSLRREMFSILGCTMELHKSAVNCHLNIRTAPSLGVGGLFTHRVCPSRRISSAPHAMASSSTSRGEEKSSPRERVRDEESTLRAIPGIGLKYEALLFSKGITTVQDLTKAFYVENQGSRARMVGYLQEHVGIRNKMYATRIAEHLETLKPDEELNQDVKQLRQQQSLTLCVEGNISAGKSTFLDMLKTMQLQEVVEVFPEPVEKWQKLGGTEVNLLDAFYRDPPRYAYTFQNYVFLTRIEQEEASRRAEKPLRILERSIFSDRMVFVRAVHEAQWLSDMELKIYDSWFNPVLSWMPSLVPDGFIYLKAEPTTCMERMKKRGRGEEAQVSISYLEDIHRKHEEWLNSSRLYADRPFSSLLPGHKGNLLMGQDAPLGSHIVLSDVVDPAYPQVPSIIENKVKILDSKCNQLLHQRIHGVPALVLDYNDSINFQTDIPALEEYGSQLTAYFQFIRALQDYQKRSQLVTFGGNSALAAEFASLARDPQAAQALMRQHAADVNFNYT